MFMRHLWNRKNNTSKVRSRRLQLENLEVRAVPAINLFGDGGYDRNTGETVTPPPPAPVPSSLGANITQIWGQSYSGGVTVVKHDRTPFSDTASIVQSMPTRLFDLLDDAWDNAKVGMESALWGGISDFIRQSRPGETYSGTPYAQFTADPQDLHFSLNGDKVVLNFTLPGNYALFSVTTHTISILGIGFSRNDDPRFYLGFDLGVSLVIDGPNGTDFSAKVIDLNICVQNTSITGLNTFGRMAVDTADSYAWANGWRGIQDQVHSLVESQVNSGISTGFQNDLRSLGWFSLWLSSLAPGYSEVSLSFDPASHHLMVHLWRDIPFQVLSNRPLALQGLGTSDPSPWSGFTVTGARTGTSNDVLTVNSPTTSSSTLTGFTISDSFTYSSTSRFGLG